MSELDPHHRGGPSRPTAGHHDSNRFHEPRNRSQPPRRESDEHSRPNRHPPRTSSVTRENSLNRQGDRRSMQTPFSSGPRPSQWGVGPNGRIMNKPEQSGTAHEIFDFSEIEKAWIAVSKFIVKFK